MNKVLPFNGPDSQGEGISMPPSNPGLNETTNTVIQHENTISQMNYDLESSQNTPEPPPPSISSPRTSFKKIYYILTFMAVLITLNFGLGAYFVYETATKEDIQEEDDYLLSKINEKISELNSTILRNKEESAKVDQKFNVSIENINKEMNNTNESNESNESNEESDSDSGDIITTRIRSGFGAIELDSLLFTSISYYTANVQLKWRISHMSDPECILNGTSLSSESVSTNGSKEISGLKSDTTYIYEITCIDEYSEKVSGSTNVIVPILIATCQELEDIGKSSTTASKDYGLLDDIDCSMTSGTSFTPVGGSDSGKRFKGTLNGFNHSINDLTLGYASTS